MSGRNKGVGSLAAGDLAYHVWNRRVGRLSLFDKPSDYAAFEMILADAHAQTRIRIAAYCLMQNHWHLLLWPRQDEELSEVLRWITVTHTQRWHAHHHTAGTGPIYQGRFKSFPVQTDEHFLTVARYVERNALRAKLVTRAEDWRRLAMVEPVAMGSKRRQADNLAQRLACGAPTRLADARESPSGRIDAGNTPTECATGPPVR